MNIELSGDIRKDKKNKGYVLGPKYDSNLLYFSGVSSIGSGARYYNVVLDSFDYSGNFIGRNASFYDRGSTGGGSGIDINWNDVGYSYNLYLSGSSINFSGFSGVTVTSNSYDYKSSNQYSFVINGLPDYSGLTTTTATTLSGNVIINSLSATTYLLEYNVSSKNTFNIDVFNYDVRVINITTGGTYSHVLNVSGVTESKRWVGFFITGNDEVRINKIKLFPIQQYL